jgi:hypothetical protein
MQELIENLDTFIGQGMSYSEWKKLTYSGKPSIERYLEKEKDVMCQFQSDGQRKDFWVKYEDNEDCFNKTFNTKER